jgi:hypothetical protein
VRSQGGDLRFVTVVTYGRTGSTVLQAALNALPGVVVRGENYGALRGLHDYVQAIAETADRHHAGRPTHPWFGSARLDPDGVLRSLRDHVVDLLLRPPRGTQWVGFKEVRYEPGHFADYDLLLEYLLFLDALLPGIVYLVNVRAPEDAARSGWWTEHGDAASVLTDSRDRLIRVASDLAAVFGETRVALLDYDEWSRDPDVLVAALASVGLPRADDAVREVLATRLVHGRADFADGADPS